jgi:hypothetical protein
MTLSSDIQAIAATHRRAAQAARGQGRRGPGRGRQGGAVIGTPATMLVALLFGAACSGPKSATHTTVDCTKADQAAIAAQAASLKKSVDWTSLVGEARVAGAVIGGCALLIMVGEYEPQPGFAKLSETPEEAIEHLRRNFGGVTWITAGGER